MAYSSSRYGYQPITTPWASSNGSAGGFPIDWHETGTYGTYTYQVFDGIPQPSSAYRPGSMTQGGASPTHACQVFEGMPQSYGLHNLERRSMLLTDGTEHTYFALPMDYPLERATSPMSPAVVGDVGITASPPLAARAACLAPLLYCDASMKVISEPLAAGHSLKRSEQQPHLGKETKESQEKRELLNQIHAKLGAMLERFKIRELEEQRKREQKELKKELEHFFHHAFDLFEEGTEDEIKGKEVCNADIISLPQEFHGENLSLGQYDVEQLVMHFSKAPKGVLTESTGNDLLLNIPNLSIGGGVRFSNEKSQQLEVIQNKLLKTEGKGEGAENAMEFGYSQSGELIFLLQHVTSKEELKLPWDPGSKKGRRLDRLCLLRLDNSEVRPLLLWDPGDQKNGMKNLTLLLQLVTNEERLILPWNPGDPIYSTKAQWRTLIHEGTGMYTYTSGCTHLKILLGFLRMKTSGQFLRLEEFKGSGDFTRKCILISLKDVLTFMSSFPLSWSCPAFPCTIEIVKYAKRSQYQVQPDLIIGLPPPPAKPPDECAQFTSRMVSELIMDRSIFFPMSCTYIAALIMSGVKGTYGMISDAFVRTGKLLKCYGLVVMIEFMNTTATSTTLEWGGGKDLGLLFLKSDGTIECPNQFMYFSCWVAVNTDAPIHLTMSCLAERSLNHNGLLFPEILNMLLLAGTCCSDRQISKCRSAMYMLTVEVKHDCSLTTLEWFSTSPFGQVSLLHCISHLAKAVVCILSNHPIYKFEMTKDFNTGNLFQVLKVVFELLLHLIVNALMAVKEILQCLSLVVKSECICISATSNISIRSFGKYLETKPIASGIPIKSINHLLNHISWVAVIPDLQIHTLTHYPVVRQSCQDGNLFHGILSIYIQASNCKVTADSAVACQGDMLETHYSHGCIIRRIYLLGQIPLYNCTPEPDWTEAAACKLANLTVGNVTMLMVVSANHVVQTVETFGNCPVIVVQSISSLALPAPNDESYGNLSKTTGKLSEMDKLIPWNQGLVVSSLNSQIQLGNIVTLWEISFEREAQLQWDPGIKNSLVYTPVVEDFDKRKCIRSEACTGSEGWCRWLNLLHC